MPTTFEITVYQSADFEEARLKPTALKHEACHAFSHSEEGQFKSIFEVYNSIMNDEYNQDPNKVLKQDFDTSYS